MLRRLSFVFFLIASIMFAGAEETRDHFIRLDLDETSGNFSLYYLTDFSNMQYEPLFNDKDAAASFSEVNVNGRVHRLGISRSFETRTEDHDGNPAVIHESSSLIITKIFYPIRTVSLPHANGIKIAISIKNKTKEDIKVGFRMLIDTHLGEGKGDTPFIIGSRSITKETLIESSSGENYWISKGKELSLMGNITNPSNNTCKNPDFVHFANWKKLNDVKWKAPFYEGRSFSYTRYSVNDSAVCYYYEPDLLEADAAFEYEIYLTTEDTAWYTETGLVRPAVAAQEKTPMPPEVQTPPQSVTNEKNESPHLFEVLASAPETVFVFEGIPAIIENAEKEAAISGEKEEFVILRKLQGVLDQFINGKISLTAQDLNEVDSVIKEYGNR